MKYLMQPLVSDAANSPLLSPDNRLYTLSSVNSGMVLATKNGKAIQSLWTESANQIWRLEKLSNGAFKIINHASGKVLDVEGGSTSGSVPLIEYSWAGSTNQQWRLQDLGTGVFQLQSVHSGLLAEVPEPRRDADTQLVQWRNNGEPQQKWLLSEVRNLDVLYDAQATIYTDANYQGQSKVLGLGSYDIRDLGVPNDTVSSLKVPAGLRVTLYEHGNFRGGHKSFSADTSYVGDDFNDVTSAILVEKVITIFRDDNFHGHSQTLGIGRYRMADIELANDSLTSIRVPQGLMAILFEHADFTGWRRVYFEDVAWLPSGINDKVSSIIVKNVGLDLPMDAIQFGGQISLESRFHNKFVGVRSDLTTSASFTSLTGDTKFTIVRAGDTRHNNLVCYGDTVALKHAHGGRYLAAKDNKQTAGDGYENGDWTRFEIVRAGATDSHSFVSRNDVVGLRSIAHGKYLSATADGRLTAEVQWIKEWEQLTIGWMQPPPPGSPGAGDPGSSTCGGAVAGWSGGAVGVCGAAACGADLCGVAACGAAASLVSACGQAMGIVVVCGAAAAVDSLVGASVCGLAATGLGLCGADACGAAACGAAACAAAACGAAACGAAACGADACAAAACGSDWSGGNACGADVGGIDACPADACGANACAINLCPADACAADACAIDIIPIIPGI